MKPKNPYKAVVIGASAGGLDALSRLLGAIPFGFKLPIMVVQHLSPHSDNYLAQHLDNLSKYTVKEAEEKESIKSHTVYIAPPNYHLMVEENFTLSLSVDEKVNYARPSLDVLFETAAFAYGKSLICIVLTGANNDGSKGALTIKKNGGLVIIQDPETAYVKTMPESVLSLLKPDYCISIEKMPEILMSLVK